MVRSSLAPTTRASYRYSLGRLQHYLALSAPGSKSIPLSQAHLAGFITHLFSCQYAASTIVSAVSAITFSHKIVGLPDPADSFYIKKLLLGVQKRTGSVDSRRPIDLPMLAQLVATTSVVIPNQFLEYCISAMFMLAFHGFLRIGEITKRPGVPVDNLIQLQDLKFVSGSHKPSMQLSIRHYKHQHSSRLVVLEIEAKSHHCPLIVMKRYLRIRGSTSGPLFIFADHTPISASYFARQLAACLSHCGYDTTRYTGHSFRIGAATTAAERGLTDVQIQNMGRWKSTAFRRYIRIPMMHS